MAVTTATTAELSTFEHAKGLITCFLFPQEKIKFKYGLLLHNIGFLKIDDKGTFLMCDGTAMTYPLIEIRKGVTRLTKGDAQWSDFRKGLEYGLAKLKHVEYQLRNQKDPHGVAFGDKAVQSLMEEAIRVYELKKASGKRKPVRKSVLPKSIYPTPSKKSKTRVASPCGLQAELKGLEKPSDCGWVQGVLIKFVPTSKKPYLVRWATKPPLQMELSQRRMRQVVNNYKTARNTKCSSDSSGENCFGL